jgi:hypothetical protein
MSVDLGGDGQLAVHDHIAIETSDHSADVIMDILGPFTQSLDPADYLMRYLDAIKDEGELWIGFNSQRSFGDRLGVGTTLIIRKDGSVINIQEWLKSIPGIKVQIGEFFTDDGRSMFFARISIKDRSQIKVPHLKFVVSIPVPRQRDYLGMPIDYAIFIEE